MKLFILLVYFYSGNKPQQKPILVTGEEMCMAMAQQFSEARKDDFVMFSCEPVKIKEGKFVTQDKKKFSL